MPRCFLPSLDVRTSAEHLVGMHGVGGPDLLTVDDVVVALLFGAGGQRRQVGAGAWLGEALAPDDVVTQQRPG